MTCYTLTTEAAPQLGFAEITYPAVANMKKE